MSPKDITVVIPTYNRPESLHRAVESLFWQSVRKEGFTVLIADNSAEASARFAFDALVGKAPEGITLHYVHAPAPGVANARNAAMDALTTQLVAFLDDDQSAPVHWLEELLATYEGYGAAVTFGPISAELPDDITTHRSYFEDFFGREPRLREGFVDKPYGCGNSLLDTHQIPGGKPWFDIRMNEVGGEDDLLWARLKQAGRIRCAGPSPTARGPARSHVGPIHRAMPASPCGWASARASSRCTASNGWPSGPSATLTAPLNSTRPFAASERSCSGKR